MNESSSGLGRTAQILQFLLKYRSAGVFTGLDLDAATLDAGTEPATEGKPAEFASDLEALGPTFIKIGQALSTRPDMVPAPYLAALERMQDEVAPLPFEDIRRGRGRRSWTCCARQGSRNWPTSAASPDPGAIRSFRRT